MSDEIKYAEKDACYEIVITKHYSQPIKKRASDYVGRDKTGTDDSYAYGQWYDTFERSKTQVFQQTIADEDFDFPAIVKAVNRL